MIPVKLALRNFMPYRDNVPPLYFVGIRTASICGDNGNGKSAIDITPGLEYIYCNAVKTSLYKMF